MVSREQAAIRDDRSSWRLAKYSSKNKKHTRLADGGNPRKGEDAKRKKTSVTVKG